MKYVDYILLEYVLRARNPVSAKDIQEHLKSEVDGYTDSLPRSGGMKNIQNRLKALTECGQFSRLIDATSDGSSNLYKGAYAPHSDDVPMSIEQACSLLMSDQHLNTFAPTRLLQGQGEYHDLISRAEAAVKGYQLKRNQSKNRIDDFLKRVAVVQRGQSLVDATNSDGLGEVLECIATCIIKQRCISLTYNGKKRVLHPFGIVFRQPKIYLLAVDTKTLKKDGASKVRPRQFLCNRIESAEVSRTAHEVPKHFDVNDYVQRGRLDMLAYADTDTVTRSFKLVLRIHGKGRDNLIKDLEDYPLSDQQELYPEPGTDNFLLTVKGMRATHSLVEWVMGRMDRVEVVKPKTLRNHVKKNVDAMYQRYQS